MLIAKKHTITKYRYAFAGYCLLFSLLTCQFWGAGKVLAPYSQDIELASSKASPWNTIENRKYGDFVKVYIPEVKEHLQGKRASWLSLWTSQNELGRPLYHLSGFSPAYLPSWILAQFTGNPWIFITFLSLGTSFLTGIFIILFCVEFKLHPVAALIAGFSLASSPFVMYWLTFPMFTATFCWTACALWSLTRLARQEDLLGWSALSFSIYSLLMTAYPQSVVFHGYILFGYGINLILRKQQSSWHSVGKFMLFAGSAAAAGVFLSLPVYLDLIHITAESARLSPDPSFFTVYLTKFNSISDAIRFFIIGTIPELYGNPIDPDYPFTYDGLSITPP